MARWLPHDPEGVVILLFAAVLGAVQFFRLQRRRRLMEDTPTARIRSAAQGYVELSGRVRLPDTPLHSPLTATPCAWWRFRIERRKSEGRNAGWELEQQGSSEAQFWLDDDSGCCIVDPAGAEVRAVNHRSWVGATPVLVPEAPGTTIWSGDAEHRYTEELILPGETLYALGQFTSIDPLQTSARDDLRDLVIAWKTEPARRAAFDRNGDGELDAAEFDQLRSAAAQLSAVKRREEAALPQTHVLHKPPGRQIFLLSTVPAQKLGTRLRWQSWAWLAASLVAAGLAGSTLLG